MMSSLPFEKFYTKAGLPPVVKLFVAEYTRADMQRILMNDYAPVSTRGKWESANTLLH